MNGLLAAIPDDRSGAKPPEPERIFGSLPTEELAAITVPELGADFVHANAAWRSGKLCVRPAGHHITRFFSSFLFILLVWIVFRQRHLRASARPVKP